MSLPAPMCESSYNVSHNWITLKEWPVAERTVAGDKYLYNPHELQQESAEKIIGVRVVDYKVRRASE